MDARNILAAAFSAAIAAAMALFVLRHATIVDFVVFWAAHRVADPYQYSELRQAIASAGWAPPIELPFAYPPSFLLLTSPLRLLPYSAAYLLWVSAGTALLVASVRHPLSPALIVSPAVIYALLWGQADLWLAGLLFLGFQRRSGVLFAICLCLKPQCAFLLPFALYGRWREWWAMMLTGAALCVASLIIYGWTAWAEWFGAVRHLASATASVGGHINVAGLWPRLLVLAVGIPAIWLSYRGEDYRLQAISVLATGLLISPHALKYSMALLAPPAASIILTDPRRFRSVFCAPLLLAPPSPLGLLALGPVPFWAMGRCTSSPRWPSR